MTPRLSRRAQIALTLTLLLAGSVATVRLQRERFLVHAAARGELSAIRLLLKVGADPASNRAGTFPLYAAIAGKEHRAAELLLAAGSPVDSVERDGATPLLLAAARGDDHAVALLLDHGASLRAAMGCGNALDQALANHHDSTANLLRKAGAEPSRGEDK